MPTYYTTISVTSADLPGSAAAGTIYAKLATRLVMPDDSIVHAQTYSWALTAGAATMILPSTDATTPRNVPFVISFLDSDTGKTTVLGTILPLTGAATVTLGSLLEAGITTTIDARTVEVDAGGIVLVPSTDFLARMDAPDGMRVLVEGTGIYRYDEPSTATANGITVIDSTAGTGNWVLEIPGVDGGMTVVNVKSYGARGNATGATGVGADDTAAIQRALDALALTGGTLYFPPGIYRTTADLVWPGRHIHIMGAGKVNTQTSIPSPLPTGCSVIYADHTGSCIRVPMSTPHRGGGSMRNMSLIGRGGSTTARGWGWDCNTSAYSDWLFDQVSIAGFTVGIEAYSTINVTVSGGDQIPTVRVLSSHIQQNKWAIKSSTDLGGDKMRFNGLFVHDCQITQNGNASGEGAIDVEGTDITIQSCVLEGQYNAVRIGNTDGFVVKGNYFEANTGDYCILLSASSGGEIGPNYYLNITSVFRVLSDASTNVVSHEPLYTRLSNFPTELCRHPKGGTSLPPNAQDYSGGTRVYSRIDKPVPAHRARPSRLTSAKTVMSLTSGTIADISPTTGKRELFSQYTTSGVGAATRTYTLPAGVALGWGTGRTYTAGQYVKNTTNVAAWSSGSTYTVGATIRTLDGGVFRMYTCAVAGAGTSTTKPTHTDAAGTPGADGYTWNYIQHRVYSLTSAGAGASTVMPTHANAGGVLESDGYTWAYVEDSTNHSTTYICCSWMFRRVSATDEGPTLNMYVNGSGSSSLGSSQLNFNRISNQGEWVIVTGAIKPPTASTTTPTTLQLDMYPWGVNPAAGLVADYRRPVVWLADDINDVTPYVPDESARNNAAPTVGTWEQGDVFWNSAPVAGSAPPFWVCVAAGTPGTWVPADIVQLAGTNTWSGVNSWTAAGCLFGASASGLTGFVHTEVNGTSASTGSATVRAGFAGVMSGNPASNSIGLFTGIYGAGVLTTAVNLTSTVGLAGGRFAPVNQAAGTITGAASVVCNAITNSGGGVITNAYGAYIAARGVGTNRYGVYVETDKSYFGGDVNTDGNVVAQAAGKGLQIKEGSNARMGRATLVGGTVTVANTSITASTRIFLSRAVGGGTRGFLEVGTVTANTSFVINSVDGAGALVADTSQVDWLLVEPSP